MKQTLLILAMSSIVAYGQEKTTFPIRTRVTVWQYTDDSVRTVQKSQYIFNDDSTKLTYVCGNDSVAYEVKKHEHKEYNAKEHFNKNCLCVGVFIISCFLGLALAVKITH